MAMLHPPEAVATRDGANEAEALLDVWRTLDGGESAEATRVVTDATSGELADSPKADDIVPRRRGRQLL
jgi:hypothetical protein